MNNFPAMTEEQRQELIDFMQGSRTYRYEEWSRLSKLRDQITLAALTAEPEYYFRKRSDGGREGPIHRTETEDSRKGSWSPLYNATPAPVLKLPAGWKLVPIEPTEAMMLNESSCQHHAWDDANCPMRESRRIIWKHMIEAAPEVE